MPAAHHEQRIDPGEEKRNAPGTESQVDSAAVDSGLNLASELLCNEPLRLLLQPHHFDANSHLEASLELDCGVGPVSLTSLLLPPAPFLERTAQREDGEQHILFDP